MDELRLGLIGMGGMAHYHMKYFPTIQRMKVTAVCDCDPEALERAKKETGCPGFAESEPLLDSGLVDAVMIVTPHYFHPPIAIAAFARGTHVLCEKPIAVDLLEARRMIEAHEAGRVRFAVMFQERTNPFYRKIRSLVADGHLGKIMRTSWIITSWFRTATYYRSAKWRATWRGEGGGVLVNQCPHNLDAFQWIVGMPSLVDAHVHLGKYHDIEVEDDVSAYFEFPNGATGVLVTNTGEAPGANRFEIVGDHGRIVLEDGRHLSFRQTTGSVREFRESSPEMWAAPETRDVQVPVPEGAASHAAITQNFVDAVLDDTSLIVEGREGIHSVELANAILLSGLRRKPVALPLDPDEFADLLDELKVRGKAPESRS